MLYRVEQLTNHVKRNKKVYITGGVCLVVGALSGTYLAHSQGQTIGIQAMQKYCWKPTQTAVEIFIEALGDPGNIIQDTTTGTIYASQGQAARELGLNPARVSEQIRGIRDTVNGHKFESLGKAMVAKAA